MSSIQDQHISAPRLPTLNRYWHFVRQMDQISLTRALQYEILTEHSLEGRVLDVGGGGLVRYLHMLACDVYHSVNIDPAADPTWVVEVGKMLPCDAEFYDAVISMNTFEHIFDVPL